MCHVKSFLMLIGRLLMATLFLVAAYGKFTGFEAYSSYMLAKKLPMVPLLLWLTIAIEFLGALSLIFGYKVRAMATLLFLFLLPVTYFMHDFWNVGDHLLKQMEMFNFLKNLGILGGLLYIIANGAGSIGFDRCYSRCDKETVIREKETVVRDAK